MIELTTELENDIKYIAASMKKLNDSKLKRRALVLLIHDHSNIGIKTIEIVLNNLENMEKIWLKAK